MDSSGKFKGVLLASVKPEFFSELFNHLNIGKQTLFYLANNQGIILSARRGGVDLGLDQKIDQKHLEKVLMANEASAIISDGYDGIKRIVSHRTIPSRDLFVTVALSVSETFQSLIERIVIQIIAILVLSILLFQAIRHLCTQIELREKITIQLDNFFAYSLDLLTIGDSQGNIIRLSKEWETMLGYNLRDFGKKKFIDFVHPDDRKQTIDAINIIAEKGVDSLGGFTNRYLAKNGKYHFLEWRAAIVDGIVYAAARDITQKIKSEEELLLFKESVENSTDAIGMSKPEGDHYYQNKAFTELFGTFDKHPSDCLYVDPTIGHKVFNSIMHDHQWAGEVKMYAVDGKIIDVDLRAYAIKDHQGKITGLVGIHNNISERKAIEKKILKSEQQVRNLSDNLPDGMVYQMIAGHKQSERKFLYLSKGVESLHGIKIEDAILDPMLIYSQVLEDDRNALRAQEDQAIAELKSFRAEIRFQHPNGKIRWALIVSSPRSDETGIIVWDGIEIDITEKKRAEEELVIAKEKAELGSRSKSEFLANISHEIRTPMNTVLGMAELLQETKLTEEQLQFLKIIQKSGTALTELISSVLEMSAIEAGTLKIENIPFDLSKELVSTLDIMKFKVESKGVKIGINIPKEMKNFLIGDPARLRQILLNLINNAFKFTDHGEISITVEEIAVTEKIVTMRFSVADTGIGIPADKRDQLFLRFSQIDSSKTKKYAGTGLGLSICKQLVGLMGGEITLHSEFGKGSIFSFTLPFQEQTPEMLKVQEKEKLEIAFNERELKILVVDDSIENQLLIEMLLKNNPFILERAMNGQEAIDRFKYNEYDLLIMDIQMPVVDGLLATMHIREFEKKNNKKRTPIIALSAYALIEDKERSYVAGCNDHITKPIKKADLLKAIWENTKREP